MPRISEETIVAIKEATDIVSFIAEYIRDLKATGKNFKARCPFHEEKTPSFIVNPERQSFHCFGCGQSGNVFSFLMKIDHISFPEAVEILANRAGIALKTQSNDPELHRKAKFYEINRWALNHFSTHLNGNSGHVARQYLTSRGFDLSVIEQFSLGYALSSWDDLLEAGKKAQFSMKDMEDVGLIVVKNEGQHYDRFRDRLMFPILDARERVVGFGGRVLQGDGVKYVNSPESIIFKKSSQLYGLHLAATTLRRERTAVLVEGYTDVMMAHQYGFKNVVATLGTALNSQHAKLLKRWVDRVIVTLDGDEAGRQAAWRALPHLFSVDLEVYLAPLENSQDPCDVLTKGGGQAFSEVLENKKDPIDLAFSKLSKQAHPDEVHRIVQSLSQLISKIPSPVRRELYLKKVSELSGLATQTLLKEMPVDQEVSSSKSRQIQPVRVLESDAVLEEELGLLTAFFENAQKIPLYLSQMESIELEHPLVKRIIQKILAYIENQDQISSDHLEAVFQEVDEMDLVALCRENPANNPDKLFIDCLKKLKKNKIKYYEQLALQARQEKDLKAFREYERKRYALTQELKGDCSIRIINNAS